MELRICFVGDSFVNGTGDPTYLGWTGRICLSARQRGHDITYYNLGVRRETTTDIHRRWQSEVACRLPDPNQGRVIFSFGVNDTTLEEGKPRVESDVSARNAHTILDQARQMFPVLMVSPVPIADREQNWRSAYLTEKLAEVCAQLGVPFLDVFSPLYSSQVWLREVAQNDGAHPLADGYSELALLVENWSAWRDWLGEGK
ncbi:lipase [Oscillatoria sp. FACHB-1407]|uniref:GDSL-type esterase/lipase family protein n=1 Tax=Oscillatoria sp. FACHB-1407 TaxID=2692847 RepID=UPI001682CE9A|nr:GDSL-type esterase/lipase family protein [Oscillatoria sp. FACHB-1407]MBD2461185.1 lipase [Oscillatoria sp. FACHB-1407]